MRACLSLLLALLLAATQCEGQQNEAATAALLASDTNADPPTTPASPTDAASNKPTNATANTGFQLPASVDTILSQMPPIQPPRSGIPPLDAFYLLFPALGSLLRWGSLFPAHTILGATQDPLPAAASKVVLVLADDVNAQKSRVTRQDSGAASSSASSASATPVMQMLNSGLIPPVARNLLNPDNLNLASLLPTLPENFNLGQIPPIVGQALDFSQLPALPGLNAMLGAPPPASAPASTPAKSVDGSVNKPPLVAANPPNSAAAFAAFFNQPTPSFDGSNNLLGLPPPPTPDAFMAGLKQFWSTPSGVGAEAAASDISEVRVRPDEPNGAAAAQPRINPALQDESQKQPQPLLWFRLPNNADQTSQKTVEDLKIESKLQAFERQVIAELKLLQQIELLAREMRANAHAQGISNDATSPYRLNYALSKTPVHKITRSDIEAILRDDFVRRLLHRELQRKTRLSQFRYPAQYGASGAIKRQTKPMEQNLNKEDVMKMMAYAYRQANEQQQGQTQQDWPGTGDAAKSAKQDKIYAAYRASQAESQWAEQQAKAQESQFMQNPAMMRQWADEQAAKVQQRQQQIQQQMMQHRQWAEQEVAKIQQQQQQLMQQQNPMMMQQQRQWEVDQQAAKQQQMMQMRQMEKEAQEAAKTQQKMMQQRQWEAEQSAAKQQQQMQQQPMQQRQWEAEQAAAKQQQMQQQQQQPMQQRQWEAEQAAAKQQQMQQQQQQPMQQRQWEAEQAAAKQQQMQQQQQQPMQQRQWEAEQAAAKQQQMQQQQQQPMQQRQWEAEQAAAKAQQMQQQTNPSIMQQRQWEAEQAAVKQQQQMQEQPMQQRQWEAEQAAAKAQQMQQQQMQQQMMQQRQWEAEQSTAKQQQQMQQQSMQQRQWEADQVAKQQQKMQQRQWEAEHMQQQQSPQDAPIVGAPQWAEAQAVKALQQHQRQQQHQQQLMMQQRQAAEQSNKHHQTQQPAEQHSAAERQWANEKMKALEEQQMTSADETMLGEAVPQMAENAGKARHKVDMLGLGGDKHKKHHLPPTIINYYYTPPAAQYGSGSYGTTYGGGYGGGSYAGGYRAAQGNDEIDEMLRQHRTMATINQHPAPANFNATTQMTTSAATATTAKATGIGKGTEAGTVKEPQPETLAASRKVQKSHPIPPPPPSATSAPFASASIHSNGDNGIVGASLGNELLQPYMGLLPIAHTDDPWMHKPYNLHYPLFSGGGSYEAYLRDSRTRRDTHIMPRSNLLTPGMLERLLRIKIEFQRRFPHLYQGMLTHQTNQTRVEVTPPLLKRRTKSKSKISKLSTTPSPSSPSTAPASVYELGAAEQSPFEQAANEEVEQELETVEQESGDVKANDKQQAELDSSDDGGIDYFHFDDEDDD